MRRTETRMCWTKKQMAASGTQTLYPGHLGAQPEPPRNRSAVSGQRSSPAFLALCPSPADGPRSCVHMRVLPPGEG